MAKKAQAKSTASAKANGKTSVKAASKAPAKAAASAKPVAKAAAKPAAKPAPAKKAPPAPAKKAPTPAPEASKKAASKGSVDKAQPAENAEKIKIDKSMTEDQIKWAEAYNKYREMQAAAYDMKATFKAASPIQHKVLGWGWIVSNENDRLEVLFKDGKRMLISNYRG